MTSRSWTRRRLVAAFPAVVMAAAGWPRTAQSGFATERSPAHPDPRPGIDASRVLTRGQLHIPEAAELFDLIRGIPQVVDGIRCYCGCADLPGFYSLLSCYEAAGMAQHCLICQGEARLVHRLHAAGWSLNGIRAAIDASFAAS